MNDGKIEPRYRITHKDGNPMNPDHRCFVLSRDTDPYAERALAFYASICKETHPQLADSIHETYDVSPLEAADAARVAIDRDAYEMARDNLIALTWEAPRRAHAY